jgi:hypothetical protein
MIFEGNLIKMNASNGKVVEYYLNLKEKIIHLNEIIGKPIKIEYTGQINCKKCGKITKKSFGQGFCYSCFIKAPEAEECVLRPELCRAHEGIARDLEFAKEHCLIDHYVYLANTSSVKVGITRHNQIPTRWIDQGANSAIIFAKTSNRYEAGIIEVELKKYFPDKTNWRTMLSDINNDVNLIAEKSKAFNFLSEINKMYYYNEDLITEIKYPVIYFPKKIKSIDFDKVSFINEKLIGIKGQYLIFENGDVINIRKHEGYYIKLEI